jgi:tetratricopeptide (TPR) repeat protein
MNHVLFSDIESVLINNIKNAKYGIDIAVAWFTNPILFDLLLSKQKDGINVRIVLTDDSINFNKADTPFQELIDSEGMVSIIPYPPLMHHKFCLIDNRLLLTGSYNWTRQAKQNIENIVISTDLSLVHAFGSEFVSLLSRAAILSNIAETKFHVMSYYESVYEELTTDNGLVEPKNQVIVPTVHEDKAPLIPVFPDSQPATNEATEISEEIQQLLDKARALYLQAKHKESLEIVDKIITANSSIPEVYHLLSCIKWRQDNYRDLVKAATKVIELDNLYYPAYNMLGIGYGGQNLANQSLENYAICLKNDPQNYTVHWNRALSYSELEDGTGLTTSLRNQFKRNFESSLDKVIELTNEQEAEDQSYHLYFTRGKAYLEKAHLGKCSFRQAKSDLLKAITLYESAPKTERDVHVFREAKQALKDADWNLNQ